MVLPFLRFVHIWRFHAELTKEAEFNHLLLESCRKYEKKKISLFQPFISLCACKLKIDCVFLLVRSISNTRPHQAKLFVKLSRIASVHIDNFFLLYCLRYKWIYGPYTPDIAVGTMDKYEFCRMLSYGLEGFHLLSASLPQSRSQKLKHLNF